ncbi:quinone oxidoreductase family protein [Georgenia satyanarayanai]|uniref:quinone oxidoreductase family protein n=1 Tax=Georgenia satyanarayanai TaxID=860221 RepID=UPI001264FD4F|nr:NADP-dependent oxidoreductase [Georgenia satyanarayanai]
MRVIGVTTPGGPEQLEVLDRPLPRPGPGELRIAVVAAAVNPTDTVLRERGADGLEAPWIPGMDAAGVVDAVGKGVELAPGDRVVAILDPRTPRGGAYAELVVVPANGVARLPDDVDLVAASSLPLNALTARRCLEVMRVPPAGTIAVTGAAGAVGGYAIELAKHAGLRVVADAKDEDVALVESFGADLVLPRGQGFPQGVREHEPGGVDALLDAAVMGAAVLPAVRDGGVVACVRGFDGEPERGIDVYTVTPADYVHDAAGLAELVDLAARGVLSLRVARTLPAEQAAEAHRQLKAGGTRGRLVLTF